MSHTSRFEIPGFPRPVTVIHDGDWSGTAIVSWEDVDGEFQRANIPASLLVQLGQKVAFEYTKNEVINFLESLESPSSDPSL